MLTDFTINTTGSAGIVSVSFGKARTAFDTNATAIPLVSTGSVQFHHLSGNEITELHASAPLRTALVNGALEARYYAFEQTPIGGHYGFGFYCLTTVSSPLSAGNCYLAGFDNAGVAGGTKTAWIGKSVSGITINPTILASTTGTWAPNLSFHPLFLWTVSGATVTLVLKNGETGSALLSVVDTSGAYISTAGEGYWARADGIATCRVFADMSVWLIR